MDVLVTCTCKNEDDPIKKDTRVATRLYVEFQTPKGR